MHNRKGVGVRQNRTGPCANTAHRVISSAPAQRVAYSCDLLTTRTEPNTSLMESKIEIMAKQTKQKLLVDEGRFDAVLSRLLKTKPIPMKQIKTTGKRPKGTLIPKQSGS
jgi:hypothetical protein